MSAGWLHTAERHSPSILAQRFLAGLGTCWRVGIDVCRIAVRDGKVGAVGEADTPDRELAWDWLVGGARDRGLWRLWQKPPSPGRQLEQGTPSLTQAHLKHLAVPLHLQQRTARRCASNWGGPDGILITASLSGFQQRSATQCVAFYRLERIL